MARYIDVEALEEAFRSNKGAEALGHDYSTFMKVLDIMDSQPTADVAEVKHGEWIDKFNRNRMATQSFCSACGKHSGIGGIESNRHKPYCPNCGAKMDGGEAE